MMRAVRFALVLSLVGAAACGSQPSAAERPRSTATLSIVSPQANDVIGGETFMLKLRLDGGRITPQVSKDLTPDEGHVHVSIDGQIQTMTFGLSQRLHTPRRGRHILQAEFVAKDHGPFSPRVLAATPFAVR